MREFVRPIIVCTHCGAKIRTGFGFSSKKDRDPKDDIHAIWSEPPGITASCPRCQNPVDTTSAYPVLANFPPAFEDLKAFYAGFTPKWEMSRDSFEVKLTEFLTATTLEGVLTEFNTVQGLQWFKQRMFYRSATAFHRALQLFLGFLTLDRHSYRTWSQVTAYYSRFYFLQAFLNLSGCTYLNVPIEPKGNASAVIYFDGKTVRHIEVSKLPKSFRPGSHELWWSVMEAMKTPDYPIEHLSFILSRLVFSPEQRNRINYSFEYLSGGFNELDWFDSGADQMLNHFMPRPRQDEDITDIDRFFGGTNPEDADDGDFYSDEAQIIWCSLLGYLQFVKSLDFPQNFVKTETVLALCDLHIGAEYPNITQGIAQSVHDVLQDGFDLDSFLEHYRSSPAPEPLTARWRLRRGEVFPKSRMN
jgi:hypothetical protein